MNLKYKINNLTYFIYLPWSCCLNFTSSLIVSYVILFSLSTIFLSINSKTLGTSFLKFCITVLSFSNFCCSSSNNASSFLLLISSGDSYHPRSRNCRAAELIFSLLKKGAGPSWKTWPKCESH